MAPVYSKKLYASVVAILASKKKNKRKKIWSRKWLLERSKISQTTFIRELKNEATDKDFINYLRMDENSFEILLKKVSSKIARNDTLMRPCISPEQRLCATLRFLATGRSYTDMQYCTRISKSSLSNLIPETCQAIYDVLREEYLKVSHSSNISKIIRKVNVIQC